MRLCIYSDLHLEFQPISLPSLQSDVAVLAGDVANGTNGIDWIRQQFPDQPVVLVAGNHEFYHQSVPAFFGRMREACRGTNIHFLEQDTFSSGEFTFLGCTLWTDFCLMGQDRQMEAWAEAAGLLTDFRRIRLEPEGRFLRSKETVEWHERSRRWLENELRRHDPSRTIVVTHHAPSSQSMPPAFRGRLLNAAFASDLESFIKASGVRLWVHGHTHHSCHYTLGQTHILSNQRGYPDEANTEFKPDLVIEL